MNKSHDLSTELNTLAIFRYILKDHIVSNFQKLAVSTCSLMSKENVL